MTNQILNNFFINLIFNERLSLRDREILKLPNIKFNTDRQSFGYFLPKFVNTVIKHTYSLPYILFKQSLFENINLYL